MKQSDLSSVARRYGVAVGSVAVATGVRALCDPWLGERSPFPLLLFAILLTAWYAGTRPAVVSAMVGLLLADYFLITPRGSLLVKELHDLLELALYLGVSSGIALLGGKMHDAREENARILQQTRDALSETEGRLSLTLRSSGIGVWSWEIAPNIVKADEHCSILFGLPIDEFPRAVQGFSALIHPDDRERVQRDIAASIERGSEYSTEFRVTWRDGTVRTLASRARVHRAASGQPIRFTGVCWDVTERRQTEEQLRRTNDDLRTSVHELERRKEQSATLSDMFGLLQACPTSSEAYDIIGQFCTHLFPSCAGALYMFNSSRNLISGVASWNTPHQSQSEFEPEDCWALRRGQPHIIDSRQIGTRCHHLEDIQQAHACLPLIAQGIGIGVLFLQQRDGAASTGFLSTDDRQLAASVTEKIAISLSNLSLQEALRRQSTRDPLTGLFNRRYLEDSVERELHRLARHGQPAGFAMLDLDHFKTFNDTFGHEGGDAVLRSFGQFLREHLRKEDIACRYGGEEFCILFGESSVEDTARRAEQLRVGVSQISVQHGGKHLAAVTVSIGVASYPKNGSTLADLIAAADDALYQAKAAGRNRVVVAAEAALSVSATK